MQRVCLCCDKEITFKGVVTLILTSANITDINTFQQANKLHLNNFTGARKDGENLVVVIPAKSAVMLELE